MNFYEFIEGLARASEKISLSIPKGKDSIKSIPDID
jgi:hypothetical protein